MTYNFIGICAGKIQIMATNPHLQACIQAHSSKITVVRESMVKHSAITERIPPTELFHLFTMDIIRKKADFIR